MPRLTDSALESVLARFVLQYAREPVLVLDGAGTLVETNRAMEELEDRELAELLSALSASPLMAGFLAELRANGRAARELPASKLEREEEALAVQTSVGAPRRGRVVGVAIDEHMVIALEGPASPSSLEEELRQCRRVQTLGLMTARIVHDLNNLLTPILIFSRDLSEHPAVDGDARGLVRDLESAAQRAAALVRDVLDFARPRAAEVETLSLNSVILALRPMLQLALGQSITLRVSLDERTTHVHVDRARLEQTLLNLVNNAVSAMPHGGELCITTANVSITPQQGEREPKSYVVLVLNDTGIGMTDEVRARAFEPFFTTRSALGGTGLGLSSVRQFVRDSGGLVQIDSQVGRGTSVIIHLPRVERESRRPGSAGRSRSDSN